MKILIGAAVAFFVGAGCRYFDIPVPSPPVLPGALLVVAMTIGYSATDRALVRRARVATTKHLCGGPTGVALLGLLCVSGILAQDLSQQIAEVMSQSPSGKAHQRYVHAKGVVCEGTFQGSSAAPDLSRAAHFQGAIVPVTVRFSDGAPNSAVADTAPDASPRGMAIRLGSGRGTDIMALSHNGFIVGNAEDFLALQKAIAATDQEQPHPWPIEAFLGSRPRALKFVQDPKPVPISFASESFYANNAFLFVNAKGEKHAGRYQITPVDGAQYLDDDAAKSKSASFLAEELKLRLAKGPAKFRLMLQLAEAGDQTNDSSIIWPDDRKKVELGILTITSVVADSVAAERKLAFDPTRLVDGIELSDDPLPALRSRVYVYSVAGRAR